MTDDHPPDDRPDPTDGPGADDRVPSTEADWGRVPIDLSAANDRHNGGDGGPSDGVDDDVRDGMDDERSDDGVEDAYTPEPGSAPVEPGNPTAENALFVVLGVLVMLLIMSRLFTVAIG